MVDFARSFPGSPGHADGYDLDTGNGHLNFDATGRVLRASVADAQLQIGSYVFVRGAMAFEKGPDADVILSDGITPAHVSTINVGAQGLTMFFGANGPYWTDLDENGSVSWSFKTGTTDPSRTLTAGSVTIGSTTYTAGTQNNVLPDETVITLSSSDAPVTLDGVQYGDLNHDGKVDVGETSELNGDAVGFAITNADLALALLKTGTTKYIGLKATADQIGFVGTSVFQLGASSVVVDLNLASGSGITESSPVVNFDTNFNEQRHLFDTNHDGTITVSELRALNGQGSTSAYSGLYTGSDPGTNVVSLATIVSALDTDHDGRLKVSEVQAFLATDSLAVTEDKNNNGEIDAGYEIQTGGDPVYLNTTRRQIHASADNVLVNVAEFLYVRGNVALDLGNRALVTVKTGIPSSIGSLGADAVTQINTALSALSRSSGRHKDQCSEGVRRCDYRDQDQDRPNGRFRSMRSLPNCNQPSPRLKTTSPIRSKARWIQQPRA